MSTYDAVLNLEPHHCRFPSGEGDKISFCGAKREIGLPYCAAHARKCFTGHSEPEAEVYRPEPVSQRILEDVA